MTQNKLTDLNNHLFMQLERLNEEEISPDQLKIEIERAKALKSIAGGIIENANLILSAQKFLAEQDADIKLPKLLNE